MRKRYTNSFINRFIVIFIIVYIVFFTSDCIYGFYFPLLNDYYRIIKPERLFYTNTDTYDLTVPVYPRMIFNPEYWDSSSYDTGLNRLDMLQQTDNEISSMNIEGEIDLNLSYGGSFSLVKGGVAGLGSSGIKEGLKYDLIEKILMQGSIYDRIFVDFDYDSTRSEKGLAEEKNIYSVEYRGKEGEFIKKVALGNRDFKIRDTRYIPIDEGNQDSFALKFVGGGTNYSVQGLLRYDVSFKGEKHFTGFKRDVNTRIYDVDYVKGKYFFIPDKNIDENSLQIYISVTVNGDVSIDGRQFKLLSQNIDYSFDNSRGFIELNEPLEGDQELAVYYQKDGYSVGNSQLGINGIIDTDGVRKNFNSSDFSEYFDTTKTFLYLKKNNFNSYWERKNLYLLEDFEGENIYNLNIQLYYTSNGGLDSYYDDILENRSFNPEDATISFDFSDGVDFYPRPFPGAKPYDPTLAPYQPGDPRNPFDPDNPIYGGTSYPATNSSILTLGISYSYYAESFFLDFNLIPGSIRVYVDGIELSSDRYSVEYTLGVIDFKTGVIKPTSKVDIYYRYSGFGGGGKSLFAGGGINFYTGNLDIYNLTAYRHPVGIKEAPNAGNESASSIINSTVVNYKLGSEEEEGAFLNVKGEVALSYTDPNPRNLAIVADMESEDNEYSIDLSDDKWMIATISQILTSPPYSLSLSTRGELFYKNYWEKNLISGDELHTIDWEIPTDHIFSYSKKAGPYNTSDKPPGGEDESIVLDYKFKKGDSYPFLSVIAPIIGKDLTVFDRFNVLFKSVDIKGKVKIYVELLSSYNEDLNGNGAIDGESSVNDHGFKITPVGGTETVIGSDRNGNSNGKLDSEDVNHNGLLDLTDSGTIIGEDGNDYLFSVSSDTSDFILVQKDIGNLVTSNKSLFQNAKVLRITVVPDESQLTAGSLDSEVTGKIIINKIWWSGSSVKNNSPEKLSISEISTGESEDVRENAFSKKYPSLYNQLHGDLLYREKSGHVEKVLDVKLTAALDPDEEVSFSKDFYSTVDFSKYEEFNLYIYQLSDLPQDLNLQLKLITSEQEYMWIDFPATLLKTGWNKISVSLDQPHHVRLNGELIGNLDTYGSLDVLKRVSSVRVIIKNSGSNPISGFEFWTDEWHLSSTKKYFDKAYYAESTLGYRGEILSLNKFPLVSDPVLTLSAERKEGYFSGNLDNFSNTYYINGNLKLVKYLKAGVTYSRSCKNELREKENIGDGFKPQTNLVSVKNYIELEFDKPYIPDIYHFFERTVSGESAIKLTKDSFNLFKSYNYRESIGLKENMFFPFSLSQSYEYTRIWDYTRSKIGDQSSFFNQSYTGSATLEQIHRVSLNYDENLSMQLLLSRDETYSGARSVSYERWRDSYIYKLGSLFKPPSANLENSVLASRNDGITFDLSIPISRNAGFNNNISSVLNQNSFFHDEKYRDFYITNSLNIYIPFSIFNDDLKITPSLSRTFEGKYERIAFIKDEGEVLIDTLKPVFMPPLYYISPFKNLGRRKDYGAVNYFRDSEFISGNSRNELKTKYDLSFDLKTAHWYLINSMDLWVAGDTVRDGDSYLQTRSYGASVEKRFENRSIANYFDSSTVAKIEYENEINFLNKILKNTVSLDLKINRLRYENRGYKVSSKLSFNAQNQKAGSKNMRLVPGDESYEQEVSEIPDSYTVENDTSFSYYWIGSLPSLPFDINVGEGRINNIETFRIENIYTFIDRRKCEAFSNIPVRITFEHRSSYSFSSDINFSAYFKIISGIEEKVLPPVTKGNILPSAGLEVGVSTKIIF